MTDTMIVALISGAFLLLSGVLVWLRFFRKDKAETRTAELANDKAESAFVDEMSERIVKAARDKIENEANLAKAVNARDKAEAKAANLQAALDFAGNTIERYENLTRSLYIEIGGQRESEKRCREDLELERTERKQETAQLFEQMQILTQKIN